jgi:hypothetical protein
MINKELSFRNLKALNDHFQNETTGHKSIAQGVSRAFKLFNHSTNINTNDLECLKHWPNTRSKPISSVPLSEKGYDEGIEIVIQWLQEHQN